MGLFFLAALVYMIKGDIIGIATSLIILALFKFRIDNLKKFIVQPVILEASEEGIFFPYCKLYLPFNCIQSIAEASEVSYMPNLGIVRINSLNINFEVSLENLTDLRKNLISKFSWAKKLNQQNGIVLVSIKIPFTVGKGKPLNFSKDQICYNLNRLLLDSRG